MKLPPRFITAKKLISEGLSTQHPIKLAVGLALVAVLFTWTAWHVIPEYGDGGGAPVAFEPVHTDTDLTIGSSPRKYRVAAGDDRGGIQNLSVGAPRSNREQVAHIENQIYGLLAKEAITSFKGNTLLNREVKRLDQQIDAMWLEAMVLQ